MARTYERLSAVKVAAQRQQGLYCDGGGLVLEGDRQWLAELDLSVRLARPQARTGLGGYPAVSLKQAREAAAECRQRLQKGVDPIDEVKARAAEATAVNDRITFGECARQYVAAYEPSWKNRTHRAQWRSILSTYVDPHLGRMPIDKVDTLAVMKVLEPIWVIKPETASRVRGRIEAVLSWAKARGMRSDENPAAWRGHLDQLLPSKSKLRPVKHHSALPYTELPRFMRQLRSHDCVAALALEFLILNASRTAEVLNASWSEVTLTDGLWSLPPHRMKSGRQHQVPLAPRSFELLAQLQQIRSGEHVFPGLKPGRPLSQMALAMLLRRLGHRQITVHGFRSSFRDWVADSTNYPADVAELALAHTIPSAVERAYRRGAMLEKRRALMAAWDAYLTSGG